MVATHDRYDRSIMTNDFKPASSSQTYCLYTLTGVDIRYSYTSSEYASTQIASAKSGQSKVVRMRLSKLDGAMVRKRDVHKSCRGDVEPEGYKKGLFVVERFTAAELNEAAAYLAAEANEGVELARELRRDIISHGGIRRSSYRGIPAHYKRLDGYGLDELAQEMGYADEDALFLEIESAENVIRGLPVVRGKRLQTFRVKDMIARAEEMLLTAYDDVYDESVPF